MSLPPVPPSKLRDGQYYLQLFKARLRLVEITAPHILPIGAFGLFSGGSFLASAGGDFYGPLVIDRGQSAELREQTTRLGQVAAEKPSEPCPTVADGLGLVKASPLQSQSDVAPLLSVFEVKSGDLRNLHVAAHDLQEALALALKLWSDTGVQFTKDGLPVGDQMTARCCCHIDNLTTEALR